MKSYQLLVRLDSQVGAHREVDFRSSNPPRCDPRRLHLSHQQSFLGPSSIQTDDLDSHTGNPVSNMTWIYSLM